MRALVRTRPVTTISLTGSDNLSPSSYQLSQLNSNPEIRPGTISLTLHTIRDLHVLVQVLRAQLDAGDPVQFVCPGRENRLSFPGGSIAGPRCVVLGQGLWASGLRVRLRTSTYQRSGVTQPTNGAAAAAEAVGRGTGTRSPLSVISANFCAKKSAPS